MLLHKSFFNSLSLKSDFFFLKPSSSPTGGASTGGPPFPSSFNQSLQLSRVKCTKHFPLPWYTILLSVFLQRSSEIIKYGWLFIKERTHSTLILKFFVMKCFCNLIYWIISLGFWNGNANRDWPFSGNLGWSVQCEWAFYEMGKALRTTCSWFNWPRLSLAYFLWVNLFNTFPFLRFMVYIHCPWPLRKSLCCTLNSFSSVPLWPPYSHHSVCQLVVFTLTARVLISCNAAIYGFYSHVNSKSHISDTIYHFYLSGVKNWR